MLQGKDCPKCSREKSAKNRRYTHEQFVEKIQLTNPNVKIIGEYIDNKTKILVSSKLCGHEWMASPDSLMGGHGCPICGKKKGRRKKSNEEFLQELKERNIGYLPLEDYVSSDTKIKVRCPLCNHIWSITPNNLLHGYGCPVCAKERSSERMRKNNPNPKFNKKEEHNSKENI